MELFMCPRGTRQNHKRPLASFRTFGRFALANDELTFVMSGPPDSWFYPGSFSMSPSEWGQRCD